MCIDDIMDLIFNPLLMRIVRWDGAVSLNERDFVDLLEVMFTYKGVKDKERVL